MNKKKIIKRTISLLCAMVLSMSTVLAALPEKAAASADILPPTDFKELSWTDFAGLSYKEYVAPVPDAEQDPAKGIYSGDLDKTLLNGNIVMGADTDIRYAGTTEYNGWYGLLILAQTDGTLQVLNSTYATPYNQIYQPSDYGLTSFVDQEFNLKISTEIDGDDYTFGIWVNDRMLGDYFTLTDADDGAGPTLGLYKREGGNNIELLPTDTGLPTGFTEISWTDFIGLRYKEYVAPVPDAAQDPAKGIYSGDLNKTLLNGNIVMGADTDIRYAGTTEYNGWYGLLILAQTDGTLRVLNSTYATPYDEIYQPSDYGLTSFVDQEFNLKISTEIDGDDYTFGIWVNNRMLGGYFTLTDADSGAGPTLGLYKREGGNNIELLPVESEAPIEFTEITWTDFKGLELKEYIAPNPDATGAKGTYSGNLDKTMFVGDVILGSETDIRYAGMPSNPGWSGLVIRAQANGTLVVNNSTFDTEYNKTYQPADFDLSSFVGVQFNLKISTEINGNNYTFGIWVNDKMLDDYFTLTESEGAGAKTLGLFDTGQGNNITLVGESDSSKLPTDFTQIGWLDFEGLECREYVMPKGNTGIYAGSLDKTLFSGDVIMGAETDIRYAGLMSNPGWSGFIIRAQASGNLLIENSTFDTKYSAVYQPADYGLSSFVNVEFNLKISTEINGNDYTFGIWVNDQMLGGYFTLTESENSEARTLGLYDTENGGNVTLVGQPKEEPDVPVEPSFPEGYKEIRWADFDGLNYQTYPAIAGDLAARGTYSKSLHETILNDNIILGAGNQIRYAGYDGWQGLVIREDAGNLVVENSTFGTSYQRTYRPGDYGITSFATDEFNLKISTAIDNSSYTFGVWVNDIMLDDYFTLAIGDCIVGSMVGFYDNGSENSFTLIPVVPIQDDIPSEKIPVPSDFKVVTLEDFEGGLRSGRLASASAVAGQLTNANDFNRTVVDIDINLATETPGDATYIRFAGETEGWVGIGFETRSNGTIVLHNWKLDLNLQTYTKDIVGFDFYKEAFNLKVSFEYIDADEDGDKDDVQIGVFFNDVLYNNRFVVAKNYKMTNYLLAYTDDSALHPLELKSTKAVIPSAPIKPDKDLKEISFSSFGIEDAEFDEIDISNFCTFGSYQTLEEDATLDGTLFHGKVKFGKAGGSELRFGGLSTPWLGIRITGNADGSIILSEAEGGLPEKQFSYSFNPYDAGCELVGVWLDLQISTQFVDSDKDGKKDDVQLGIWFNDVLYMNEYIILRDYAPHMGTYLSIYCFNEEGYIAIKSVEVDNTISLSMFGFDDDYEKCFKASQKDKVEGEPLGVTTEYDIVEYKFSEGKKASEVELVDDNTVDKSMNGWKYGIFGLAGVVVLAGIIICIILAKKKKEK